MKTDRLRNAVDDPPPEWLPQPTYTAHVDPRGGYMAVLNVKFMRGGGWVVAARGTTEELAIRALEARLSRLREEPEA